MKCIGKECGYNKNNCGEYCNLVGAFGVCKGYECFIDERIQTLRDELRSITDNIERLAIERVLIEKRQ